MRKFSSLLILFTVAAAAFAAEPTTWTIDPGHSHIGFSIRHMMVSNTRGSFEKFAGTVVGDPADPLKSRVEVTIQTASIDTQNANRDEHLRSADFFDVGKYPTITFRSKRIEKRGDGALRLVGDLTIKDVTREVVLEVEGPTPEVEAGASTRIGVSASTRVNRKDFGLTWNRVLEAGGVAVGDEVRITIELELVKQKPQPAS